MRTKQVLLIGFLFLTLVLVGLQGCAKKRSLTLKPVEEKKVEYEHRFCVMTKFDVPTELLDKKAPEPACEIEDPKTGKRQMNPMAMHLEVNLVWNVTTEHGDKKQVEMPGLSTTFCLTKDRLFVEACESDSHLKEALPLRFPFERFKREFKSHPFEASVWRTFRVSPFVELLPPSIWPLKIKWPVKIEYPIYEEAPNKLWERLTSPPLVLKRIDYLLITAESAAGSFEPVLCKVGAKIPKPKEQGGGFESKVLNPKGESALALINPVPGTVLLISREGFSTVDLMVKDDLSLQGDKEFLVEGVQLNAYETFYLVKLKQVTPKPRHDPRSR